VKAAFASACIDEACELAERFDAMAEPLPIRAATRRALLQAIRHTTALLQSG
jgi:hypothetical protein